MASSKKCEQNGVKGMSCLMVLPHFDIIKSVQTDYMHGVCLGAVKRWLSIWLGKLKLHPSFKPMSKSNQTELNRRLMSLKPYSRINYKPRSLDHLAKLRAVEYKYLLFYYLLYATANLIGKRYIDHFELLSAAIYILCKEQIREDEIKCADEMLNTICDQFEEYYGEKSVTLNIHLLRHYGSIVRNTGPLWASSLFGFETNMGVLCRYSCGGASTLSNKSPKNTSFQRVSMINYH